MSAAPTSTERPCSDSLRASLPIVVVFPVPFTPTTSMTLGSPRERERRCVAEERLDLLDERVLEPAGDAASLEPAHELRGRRDTDIAADERLLEPFPRLVVGRIERRRRQLGRQRPPALRQRVAHATEEPCPLGLVRLRDLVAEKLGPGVGSRRRGEGLLVC